MMTQYIFSRIVRGMREAHPQLFTHRDRISVAVVGAIPDEDTIS